MPDQVEVQVSCPDPPQEYLCLPEPVKPVCDRTHEGPSCQEGVLN
jgi:hypothetical protein